jgi:hypothetical protein
MADLEQLVKKVGKLTGVKWRPASEDDLETLRDLEVPERVVEFFAKYAPDEAVEYGPCIYPIEKLVSMCEDGGVSTAAYKAGLIPFGDLMTGDTLCFDPEVLDAEGWPAVVCVSHERVSAKSSVAKVVAGTTPYCANLPAVLEMMLANAAKKRGK